MTVVSNRGDGSGKPPNRFPLRGTVRSDDPNQTREARVKGPMDSDSGEIERYPLRGTVRSDDKRGKRKGSR